MANKKKSLYDELDFQPEVEAVAEEEDIGFIPDEPASEAYDPSFIPGMAPVPAMKKALGGAASALDVLESPVRAGVSEFAKGKYITGDTSERLNLLGRSAGAALEQLKKNIAAPLTAPAEVPSYIDIAERELGQNPLISSLLGEKGIKGASLVSGIGAEIAAPSATAKLLTKAKHIPSLGEKISKFTKTTKEGLKAVERAQLSRIIGKFQNKKQYKMAKPEEISAALVDAEVSKYMDDPNKMYEALTGESPSKYEEVSPGLSKEVKVKNIGVIEQKSRAMRDEVTKIADDAGVKVKVPTFAVREKVKQKMLLEDPLSGRRLSPDEVEKRSQLIDEILKPYEEEIVPGVPLAATMERSDFVGEVVPPLPMGAPDRFPRVPEVPSPEFPPRPEFGGIEIPNILRSPEDINRMGYPEMGSKFDVVRKYPARPIPPESYGGVVSKEAEAAYKKELRAWESEVSKLDKEYDAQIAAKEADTSARLAGAEKVRQSLEKDALDKYNVAIREWESEVNRLKSEFDESVKNNRRLSKKIEETKIQHAADRLMERLKRDKQYKEEVMEADLKYRDHLIESLNSKVYNVPRHWSLRDMMELRTNLGKRIATDFGKDTPLTMEKEIVESIYHELRNEIAGALEGLPSNVKGLDGLPLSATDYYDIQSNALHRLIQGKEVLKTAMQAKAKGPDATAQALATMVGLGTAGGMAAGSMLLGSEAVTIPATVLGVAATRGAYRAALGKSPEMIGSGARMLRKGIETVEQFPEEVLKVMGAGSRGLRDEYVTEPPMDEGRSPQSIDGAPARKSNLYITPKGEILTPMDITKFKIPLSTEGILENKDKVMAKLTQAGVPEHLVDTLAIGLDEDPEAIKSIAPVLVHQFPELFQRAKYKIFDGKFIDPNESARAADNISKREDLSSIERAKMINMINKKGEVPEGLL